MPARGGAVSLRQLSSIQHQWGNGEHVLHGRGVRGPCLVGGGGSPDSLASSDYEEHHRCHRPRNEGREPNNGGQFLPVGCFGGRLGHMQPAGEELGGVSIPFTDPLTSTTTPLQLAFNPGLPLPQQPAPLIITWIPYFISPGLPSLCSQDNTTGDIGSGLVPGPVQDLSPGLFSPSAHTGQFPSFCGLGQDGITDFDLLPCIGDYTPTLDSWPGSSLPTQPAPSPFPQPTPQLSLTNYSFLPTPSPGTSPTSLSFLPTPSSGTSPTSLSFLSTPSSGTSPTSHSFLLEPSSDTSPITTQIPSSPRNGRLSCPNCDKAFSTKAQVS